jgi:hypothetical protein
MLATEGLAVRCDNLPICLQAYVRQAVCRLGWQLLRWVLLCLQDSVLYINDSTQAVDAICSQGLAYVLLSAITV